MDGDTVRGAAVTAEGLGMDGPRGRVFHNVSLQAPPGSLIAVRGPSGSGRTCLILTLTGRMRPTTGRAEVAGHRLPRRAAAVRRISALGPVASVTDLEPALSVAEHLKERTLLERRFAASPTAVLHPLRERSAARSRAHEALSAAGLTAAGREGAVSDGELRTPVRDLDRPDVFRLGVALALTAAPRLLAVDDVGHKLSPDEHAAAWALLRSLADRGITVLAVGDPPDGVAALTVRTRPAKEDV